MDWISHWDDSEGLPEINNISFLNCKRNSPDYLEKEKTIINQYYKLLEKLKTVIITNISEWPRKSIV